MLKQGGWWQWSLLQSRKIKGRAAVFVLSSRVSLSPSFCKEVGSTHGQAPWHQVQQWGSSSPGNVSACCFLLQHCLRCWEAPQLLGTLQGGACSGSYISKCLSFPVQRASLQQLNWIQFMHSGFSCKAIKHTLKHQRYNSEAILWLLLPGNLLMNLEKWLQCRQNQSTTFRKR